jgi:hypothetical protein
MGDWGKCGVSLGLKTEKKLMFKIKGGKYEK